MNKQPVSFLQTDPKWSGLPYALPGESSTIGSAGCGPTAMAMVLATWADPKVTPKSECAWSLANGGKAFRQGTYYSYFPKAAKRYGLTCYQVNSANIKGNANSPHHATAKAAIDNGDLVIACMGPGLWTRSGHFVLVWKVIEDTVFINDPASTSASRTQGSYSLFKTQVKYYFIIKRPAQKEEPDMTEEQTRKIVREEISKATGEIVKAVLAAMPKEKVFDTIEEIEKGAPWAAKAVQRLIDHGTLKGTGDGLDLTYSDLRHMAWNEREGLYD